MLLHAGMIFYSHQIHKNVPFKAQNSPSQLQQYMNCELLDVQAGFRKGRGTRDQIANICWITEKVREFQKNTCFMTTPKPLTV